MTETHTASYTRVACVVCAACLFAATVATVRAQTPANAVASASPETNAAVQLPEVVVVAQKEPADAQSLPVSVTAFQRDTIDAAGISVVKDAAAGVPNVFVAEFGPRRLSHPYVRGIGAGPDNPGVTTSLDGVPQLGAGSSSIELLDIDQIEFARGAQSTLFGRNALGGIININSRRPSPEWTLESGVAAGNYGYGAGTLRVSGPLAFDMLDLTIAGGYSRRDGYTKNVLTGEDVDSRDAWFGKAQVSLASKERFDARLVVSAERDEDGDYALGDLRSLRTTPHEVAHDFEGYTTRDILMPTLLLTYHGDAVEMKSISGGVWWKIEEATDLDYSAYPLMTSLNEEDHFQFTQEFRLASPKDSPLDLSDWLSARWQSGVFFFHQNHEKNNVISQLPALTQQAFDLESGTTSDTDRSGAGIYGQGSLTAWKKLELAAGLRFDSEHASAELESSSSFSPPSSLNLSRDFSEVSPRASLSYRVMPAAMTFASVGHGFRAGGFNAGAPTGSESYGEEDSWDYEIGAKTRWLNGRMQINIALFWINWNELQMYVPNPLMPGNFYIANAGEAESKGAELELQCRPVAGWDVFGGLGWTDAQFKDGSMAQGADVSGNDLPFAPDLTGNLGTQYSLALAGTLNMFARAVVTYCGEYDYNASNAESQNGYTLADFRLGVRDSAWQVEGWIMNAFDTEYEPVAFQYQLAESGYLGESGAPMTFGVRGSLTF